MNLAIRASCIIAGVLFISLSTVEAMDFDNFLENILEKAVKEINLGTIDEEVEGTGEPDKSPLQGAKYISMTYHRQFWQNYPLFCPFGRSPAKSLLLNTPLSVPKVRILLLGGFCVF